VTISRHSRPSANMDSRAWTWPSTRRSRRRRSLTTSSGSFIAYLLLGLNWLRPARQRLRFGAAAREACRTAAAPQAGHLDRVSVDVPGDDGHGIGAIAEQLWVGGPDQPQGSGGDQRHPSGARTCPRLKRTSVRRSSDGSVVVSLRWSRSRPEGRDWRSPRWPTTKRRGERAAARRGGYAKYWRTARWRPEPP